MTNRADVGDAIDLEPFVDVESARAISEAQQGNGSSKVVSQWRGVGLKVQLGMIKGVSGKRLDKILPFRFQCPPLEQIEFVFQYNHIEYDTLQDGQMSRRAGRMLTTVSFETLVVEGWHRFVVGRDMWDYKDSNNALKTVNNLGRPVYLQMAHNWPSTEFEMMATIRQLNIVEKAGEPDGRYYNISFSEWREAEVDRDGHGGARSGVKGDGKWPKHIVLDKTDTLVSLATKYWGKPSEAKYLGMVNGLGGWGARDPIVDSKAFQAGDKFLIPEPPETGLASAQIARIPGATPLGSATERE